MIRLENNNRKIEIRKAKADDRENVIKVEAAATPNLRYLSRVFDMFVSDPRGEFSVVEMDGRMVGCGKFTIMPDGSGWLETLRVVPSHQGHGIGKHLFTRYFTLAHRQGVTTMRMYTGLNNAVSKGLAERFGFRLAATYRGAWLPCRPEAGHKTATAFKQVSNPQKAEALLLSFRKKWTGFLVMNRTFYAVTPALSADLTKKGLVYEDPASGSTIILGARFMPEQALHIGILGGDIAAGLAFAMQKGVACGAKRLSCLFPASDEQMQYRLVRHGFQLEASDFIVLEVQV